MQEFIFYLKLKGFNGNSLLIQETIDENLNSKKSLLKKNLSSDSKIEFTITRSGKDSFKVRSMILNNESISEDVAISQLEINLISIHKKGILNIGIHEWELSIESSL